MQSRGLDEPNHKQSCHMCRYKTRQAGTYRREGDGKTSPLRLATGPQPGKSMLPTKHTPKARKEPSGSIPSGETRRQNTCGQHKYTKTRPGKG